MTIVSHIIHEDFIESPYQNKNHEVKIMYHNNDLRSNTVERK